MKRIEERDRRQYPRFPQLLELQAHKAQPFGAILKKDNAIVGRVQNVSKGGLCLISPRPMAGLSVVRCEICVSEIPVSIPTLMLVRWTRKQNLQAEIYLTGLQFLL